MPCVVDRLIQQALLQVLQKRWDRTFSEHSYGFRPGRSAHQAVAQAQRYIAAGYNVVVDLDLEKFFDRVNHDGIVNLSYVEQDGYQTERAGHTAVTASFQWFAASALKIRSVDRETR